MMFVLAEFETRSTFEATVAHSINDKLDVVACQIENEFFCGQNPEKSLMLISFESLEDDEHLRAQTGL
jgi:hypothetical protein